MNEPEIGGTPLVLAESRDAALAEELSLLIDGATNYAIYMLDRQGRVTIWNQGAQRIKGWTEHEIIGRDMAIFYPRDDIARGKPALDLARANREGRIEEDSWRVRKDGSEFLASVTITALYDAAGALRGYGKVIRDVTDTRAVEAAVARREHHLRSILATVPDAMVVMDERGIVSSFSTAAQRLFGYAEDEVVGRNVSMLMPIGDRGAHDDHLATYRATGVRHVVGSVRTSIARRRCGEAFPIELAVGEVSISGERIFTGFIRDLTQRLANERRVRELQSELVHVARVSAMGTMASTLAHEINQPLAAIANYLETARAMIDGGDGIADVGEAIDLAVAQSHRAGDIVRRLRAFVDGGDTGFAIEPVASLIDEACSLALIDAHQAGVSVARDIPDGLDRVLVDRIQIQQVLVNLIRNAIHAMRASPIRELRICARCDNEAWVRLTVADTGQGIDADVRAHLFEAFATTKEDGMGLGLSICRTIVEAHGGRIWAEEAAGGGTAFHFCVPAAERVDVAA